MQTATTIFEPTNIGGLTLKNRIVMAPMTRNRASVAGVPSDLAATYYAQRASAGLIITEGTQPSPDGQGYPRTPGIHSAEQIEAWRKITDAVHAKGGRIFLQIMHTGRIAHRLNRTVYRPPVAPSAIQALGTIYTDSLGPQPHSLPRALATEEIPSVIEEYRRATINALAAGFDGVELHAANGYLPMQFLSSNSNQRTDRYGGSVQNRARFVIETLEAMIDGAGSASKIGLRVSPGNTFNDMHDANPVGTHLHLTEEVSPLGLAYLHIQQQPKDVHTGGVFDPVKLLRPIFDGPIIATGGFDRDSANRLLSNGGADLIGFAALFITNPDLVERFRSGAPLAPPDAATFYTPGPKGYTDYPVLGTEALVGALAAGGRWS
ncbi:alkene reductase [Nitrospira sp. NS4]|uniref:alkene reductase n=1 Tax=Nitrospira sp. NS4 TaxID=3414498 RepID=UPI003C303A66